MTEYVRPTGTGETYTIKEREILGRFNYEGLMPYKDFEGYYCLSCGQVINVKCVKCGTWSENRQHLPVSAVDDVFFVDRPLTVFKLHGVFWSPVQCRKCDFKFRIMVK